MFWNDGDAVYLFYTVSFLYLGLSSEYHSSANQEIRMDSLHIQSEIGLRFATTYISGLMYNELNSTDVAVFVVILPEDALISNFTIEKDDGLLLGRVHPLFKNGSKQVNTIMPKNTRGHDRRRFPDTYIFEYSERLLPGKHVTFNLTYHQLLKRKKGVYTHRLYLDSGQPIDDLSVQVTVQEPTEITSLIIPPFRNFNLKNTETVQAQSDDISIRLWPQRRKALVRYSPTPAQQSELGISGQFILYYDVLHEANKSDLLIGEGYFAQFTVPAVTNVIPNDILFMLDVSYSMKGRKLLQLKAAMLTILSEMKESDRVNILQFSDVTHLWAPVMMEATEENLRLAKKYIFGMKAKKMTNIAEAFTKGMELLRDSQTNTNRYQVILFLTDGSATSGETDTYKILRHVHTTNRWKVPIFGIALGKDADYTFVKMVSSPNQGEGREVSEDSDVVTQMSGFYSEVASTVLINVSFMYPEDVVDLSSLTKTNFKSYRLGAEMVIAGKINERQSNQTFTQILTATTDVGDFGIEQELNRFYTEENRHKAEDSHQMLYEIAIVELLWAYLTVHQLLVEAEAELNYEQRSQIEEDIKGIAMKYNFVTSMTPMKIVNAETSGRATMEEKTGDRDLDTSDGQASHSTVQGDMPVWPETRRYWHHRSRTGHPSRRYRHHRSKSGHAYAVGGGGDPHFLVRVEGIDHPLCFDVRGESGQVYQLFQDLENGISVDAGIVSGRRRDKFGVLRTYIGAISIFSDDHLLQVNPKLIKLNNRRIRWEYDRIVQFGGNRIIVEDYGKRLRIVYPFGTEIVVKRHLRTLHNDEGASFLNVYIENKSGLSGDSTGLIGQFASDDEKVVLNKTWFDSLKNKTMGLFVIQLKQRISPNGVLLGPLQLQPDTSTILVQAKLVMHKKVIGSNEENCWKFSSKEASKLHGGPEKYIRKDAALLNE